MVLVQQEGRGILLELDSSITLFQGLINDFVHSSKLLEIDIVHLH